MIAYVKSKWRFLLIIAMLVILNIWVWYNALTVGGEPQMKSAETGNAAAVLQGWMRS